MILIPIAAGNALDPKLVGGKAFNLQRLCELGLPVASAVVLPAKMQSKLSSMSAVDFRKIIDSVDNFKDVKVFAVRSSAIGEDGLEHSYAGIFDSFLNIPRELVYEHVLRVVASQNSERSKMYATARNQPEVEMSVVIQEMLTPDFAGVAFSVDPIEKDNRIGLIELIVGCGEDLVAGKKTPHSIRFNKLTKMSRVIRVGADEVPMETIQLVCDTLLPILNILEDAYEVPVDVEWAFQHRKVYLLQARPITA